MSSPLFECHFALSGEDFDQRIMDEMMKLFKRKHKKDMSTDKRALQKLRRAAEGAKRTLSTNMQVILHGVLHTDDGCVCVGPD